MADTLRRGARTALFLGGRALREPGLRAAARVATTVGCRLICETFPARIERGHGLPAVERLPYFPDHALEALGTLSDLILVGGREPVSFFRYPGLPSRLVPEGCARHVLAGAAEDTVAALEALAETLGAPRQSTLPPRSKPPRGTGPLTPESLGAVVAALQPEGAIVVDEAITSGLPHFLAAAAAPPHTHLCLTGGAIGMGLPLATGAAIACPERPVLALQADGSAMYTLQSLWSQAREGLNVTTVLCANRSYRILEIELARAGARKLGPTARALTDLGHPELDWVALAHGHGVPATRATTAEELAEQLERALEEPGPHLIEALL